MTNKIKAYIALTLVVVIVLLTLVSNKFLFSSKHVAIEEDFSLFHNDYYIYINNFKELYSKEYKIATDIILFKDKDSLFSKPYLVTDYTRICMSLYDDKELHDHLSYNALITKYGSNLLNQLISEKSLDYELAQKAKDSIYQMIKVIQKEYEVETDYGKNKSLQTVWNFKIDSLLFSTKANEKQFPNIYTGIDNYFYGKPTTQVKVYDFAIVSQENYKHGVEFNVTTIFNTHQTFSTDILKQEHEAYEFDYLDITEVYVDNKKGFEIIGINEKENYTLQSLIFSYNNNTYDVSISYPSDIDIEPLIDSYFSSVRFSDNTDFWTEILKDDFPENVRNISPDELPKKEDLLVFEKSDTSDPALIFNTPFEHNNQLIIPFYPIMHHANDIEVILLILNDEKKFTNDIAPMHQMIPIDINELNDGVNHIQIGYIEKNREININHVPYFYSVHINYTK